MTMPKYITAKERFQRTRRFERDSRVRTKCAFLDENHKYRCNHILMLGLSSLRKLVAASIAMIVVAVLLLAVFLSPKPQYDVTIFARAVLTIVATSLQSQKLMRPQHLH